MVPPPDKASLAQYLLISVWYHRVKIPSRYSVLVRQAGTWDLGPFAAVLASGQSLLQQQIQRSYKGLKITVRMCSWGKS